MDYDDDGYDQYRDDLAMGRIYPDGSPREPDEPDYDCWNCNDTGRVIVFDEESPKGREQDCSECRPTPEQAAAREIERQRARDEFARAVAAGEIDPDEDPWA